MPCFVICNLGCKIYSVNTIICHITMFNFKLSFLKYINCTSEINMAPKILPLTLMLWWRELGNLSALTLAMWHWLDCKQQRKGCQVVGLEKPGGGRALLHFTGTHQTVTQQVFAPYSDKAKCQPFGSSHITVFICGGLATLYILFVNEDFNALLDHADTRIESCSWLAYYLLRSEQMLAGLWDRKSRNIISE